MSFPTTFKNVPLVTRTSFRERERQHRREELWNKVESLAAKSPSYDMIKVQSSECNNDALSPEQDDEVILDNLEQEAQEVPIGQIKIEN